MLPSYTLALGKTEACEKIMNYINEQTQIKETILKKITEVPFSVGGDTTYDKERGDK